MANSINWRGKSGQSYAYWFLDSLAASAIKAEPGNYMFVKSTQKGWFPVYIGQADDLKARLPTHERWTEAKRAGATHVMGHTTHGGEAVRCAEEKDLIQFWNPPLNSQHKQAM